MRSSRGTVSWYFLYTDCENDVSLLMTTNKVLKAINFQQLSMPYFHNMLDQFFLTGFRYLLDNILMASIYTDHSKPVKIKTKFSSGNVPKPSDSNWSNNTWKLWTLHLPLKRCQMCGEWNRHSAHHCKWYFATRFCCFHRSQHQMLVYLSLHSVKVPQNINSHSMESH